MKQFHVIVKTPKAYVVLGTQDSTHLPCLMIVINVKLSTLNPSPANRARMVVVKQQRVIFLQRKSVFFAQGTNEGLVLVVTVVCPARRCVLLQISESPCSTRRGSALDMTLLALRARRVLVSNFVKFCCGLKFLTGSAGFQWYSLGRQCLKIPFELRLGLRSVHCASQSVF